MGSHQAAHPTPPSSVKLCRVLSRRHIQGCATYMHFEGVSFYFTFEAILKSCHLSSSFTAKGRNPRKKTYCPKWGRGPAQIDYNNLFNSEFPLCQCKYTWPGHPSRYFSILCFPFSPSQLPSLSGRSSKLVKSWWLLQGGLTPLAHHHSQLAVLIPISPTRQNKQDQPILRWPSTSDPMTYQYNRHHQTWWS